MRQPQNPVQILAYQTNVDAYWVRIPCFHFGEAWESLARLALLDCGCSMPRIDDAMMDLLATHMETELALYITIVAEERILIAENQKPAGYVDIPVESFSSFSDALNEIDQRAKIHRGDQLAEHPILELSLKGYGWLLVHFRFGPHELRETVSYLSQPLEHLLLLALCLELGVNQYHWSWNLEGAYIHASLDDNKQPYPVITFCESFDSEPHITDQQRFQVMVDRRELSRQIRAAAADLLKTQGLGGYRCNWGQAFPRDLFMALSRVHEK